MQDDSFQPLREILLNAATRYLTVKPNGLVIAQDVAPDPVVAATLRSHGGARTLYRGRRPHCRSLNGIHAVDDREKRCKTCHLRKHCTPQVRVDLLIGDASYRLLLAYTSAQHFLEFVGELARQGKPTEDIAIVIRTVDRGSWGELRFEAQSRD